MDSPYVKIALFLMAVMVLAALTMRLSTPSLGPVDETHRVRHPAGFSVVIPRDWKATITFASNGQRPSINALPVQSIGRLPGFSLTQLPGPLDEPKLVAGEFQGQPARVYEGMEKDASNFSAQFERHGRTYLLSLRLYSFEPIRGGAWWPFLMSVRVEPEPSTVPATLPASVP